MKKTGGLRRVAWWLVVAMVVGLAVPTLARLFGIENGVLMVAVAITPWITFACVVPLIAALLLRAWVVAGAAGAMLALGLFWLAPLYVGGGGGGEPVVTVATVNMTFGKGDAAAIVAMIDEYDVDLLSVQEITPEGAAALSAAGIDRLLPHGEVLAEPGITGTALYSTFPLKRVRELDGYLSGHIAAVASTPIDDITFLAVHPRAPGGANHDGWAQEMTWLKEDLAALTGPVIVAGDFNTSRDHKVFREIEGLGYVDAADRMDAGFRPTFPVNRELFPIVAIDHVMTRDVPLRPATFELVTIPDADHIAMIVGYAASGGA